MKRKTTIFLVLSIFTVILLTAPIVGTLNGAYTEQISDDYKNKLEIQKANQDLIDQYLETKSSSEGLTKIGNLDVDFGNAYKIFRYATTSIIIVSGLGGGATYIDVGNPSNPIVLGNYYNGGTIYDAVIQSNYGYIGGTTGLEAGGVSDYGDIESLGSYYDGNTVLDIEVIGFNALYVAEGSAGLKVFNMKDNRTNFNVVAADTYGVSEIVSIKADPQNNLCFLAAGNDGVVVLDIIRPFSPQYITTLKNGITDSRSMDFSARILYVADGNNGIKVYNYSSLTAFNYVTRVSISSGYAQFIKWDVNYKLFLSTGVGGGLSLYNITNLTSITKRWTQTYTPGAAFDIAIYSTTVYLANYFDLKIINMFNSSNPVIYSNLIFAGEPSAVSLEGTKGILASGQSGLSIMDITDPINPILISEYVNLGTSIYDIELKGNYIYCATSNGLLVLSIATVTNPVVTGQLALGRARAIEIVGSTAYLGIDGVGFVSVNIANPASPSLLKSLATAGLVTEIAIQSNYAYISVNTAGFQVVDITTPATMSIVATQDTVKANGIDVMGDIVIIADTTNGLEVYNVSNLAGITHITNLLSAYNVSKVDFTGNEIYVAAKEDGIYLLDANNITNITQKAHFNDGGSSEYVKFYNSLVYVADGVDSFEILGIDTDLDNLADYVENNVWTTNPNLPDTDFDGIDDGDEVDYWLDRGVDPLSDWDNDGLANILDDDSDNDLILDGDEVNIYHSDPIDLDSDNDNVSDTDEVYTYGTDPADSDTDDDSLTDGEEIYGIYAPTNPAANSTGYVNGCDPLDFDTDDDGPSDGWEILYGYNPLVADSGLDDDSDGLNASQEFIWHTDPYDDDTDDDGLLDGEEVFTYGTSPTNWDTDGDFIDDKYEIDNGYDPLDPSNGTADDDGDGLTNWEEYYWQTDPRDSDTDNDGMDDKWEVYFGTNPFIDDTLLDYDQDGLTNWEEYNLGTDPNDPDSDNDGFLDSVEVEYGSDPNDPNSHPPRTTPTPSVGFGLLITLSIVSLASLAILITRRYYHK
ncbi:MAG: hypothetical protein FK734_09625 [Asgard group archaeon]|nr:hypothetical protein [Asgard group archaeon]